MIAMGVDLGRKHDSTALCVVSSDENGIVKVIAVHELKDTPFAQQIDHIKRLAARYEPSSIHVDSTGLGLPVVEELRRQLGAVIEAVSFTSQSKAELVSRAVVLLQDRKLRLPSHARLRDELHSVTRQVTKDGNVLYRVSQKFGFSGAEYHHADLAWSLMLALRGVRDGGETLPIFTDSDRNIISVDDRAFAPVSRDPSGWPIIRTNWTWGEYEEYEDHIRIGGTMWPKNLWRRDHNGKLPWEE
jgi:phage FluMu gp28-like protein